MTDGIYLDDGPLHPMLILQFLAPIAGLTLLLLLSAGVCAAWDTIRRRR